MGRVRLTISTNGVTRDKALVALFSIPRLQNHIPSTWITDVGNHPALLVVLRETLGSVDRFELLPSIVPPLLDR